MAHDIKLIKSDVTVEPIEEECECGAGPVTDYVHVDYRSAGMKVAVGRYCRTCALETAEAIQEGLPDEETT